MRRIAFALGFIAILATSYGIEINACEDVANGMFLADLTNCSQYLTCYGNITYGPFPCPDGYQFSPNTQTCDPEGDARCIQQCNSSLSTFAYDKTCTKYVLCYDGTPILRECLDGLQYNSETGRCDVPDSVDCMANLCAPNNVNEIVFLTSNTNCSKYFICYNGEPVPQECSAGLFYNPDKQGCDYADNVDCTVSARVVVSHSKQPLVRANIKCPKEGSHFFANESDEASYFFCVKGSGVQLSCSPGLVYDKVKETCRDPSNITK